MTDSCADRVWRMLRGSLEDGQGADSMKLDAIASTGVVHCPVSHILQHCWLLFNLDSTRPWLLLPSLENL